MKLKKFQFFPYHIVPLGPHPRTREPGPESAEDTMNAFLAGPVLVDKAQVAVGGHPAGPLIIVAFLYEDATFSSPRQALPKAKLFLAHTVEGKEREIPERLEAFLDRTGSVTDSAIGVLAGEKGQAVATLVRYEEPA